MFKPSAVALTSAVVLPDSIVTTPRMNISASRHATVDLFEGHRIEATLTHSRRAPLSLTLVHVEDTLDGIPPRRDTVATINLTCDDAAVAFRELVAWAFAQLPELRASVAPLEIAAGDVRDEGDSIESLDLYGPESLEYSAARARLEAEAAERNTSAWS